MTWRPLHDPYRQHRETPYNVRPIWVTRKEWIEPQLLADIHHLHPAFNIIGAYWSPAINGEGPPEFAQPLPDKTALPLQSEE